MDTHRTSAVPIRPKPFLQRPSITTRDQLPTTIQELTDRLETAGAALMGLIVKGLRPSPIRSAMPSPVHAEAEAYGWTEAEMPLPLPSARCITAMDATFAWVDLIPLDAPPRGSAERRSTAGGAILRRIVLARAMVNPRTGRATYSTRRLAELLHCSPQTIGAWHGRGLAIILAGLHPPLPIVPWRHNRGPDWDRATS